MKTLGVDTSTSVNTVAICDGDRVIAETAVDCGRAHAERLMATVDWVLSEAGLRLPQLDLLAVSIGPGSFTGLRIGVSAWKGLAMASGLPLVGVPTLDAMTRLGVFNDAVVCPILDAKMREVFGAIYRYSNGVREKLTKERVAPVESFCEEAPPGTIFYGDGTMAYGGAILAKRPDVRVLNGALGSPRASAVCAEGAEIAARGLAGGPESVTPVYLRMSQPEVLRAQAAP